MNGNRNILLVEDNDDDVILIQRALRKGGVDAPIRVAKDGEEAIDFLTGIGVYHETPVSALPTMVLLDLKLPRKSGFEVLEWIKTHQDLSAMPVVVFTSSVQDSDLKQAYALGANSYLKKPVTMAETTELLKAVGTYWLDYNKRSPLLRREP
jgi:CheY-like chemotaxis protein